MPNGGRLYEFSESIGATPTVSCPVGIQQSNLRTCCRIRCSNDLASNYS